MYRGRFRLMHSMCERQEEQIRDAPPLVNASPSWQKTFTTGHTSNGFVQQVIVILATAPEFFRTP